MLSEAEKARADRFRFEHDRVLYMTSHALLRMMLSFFCDIEPKDWLFDQTSYGKPVVRDGLPKFYFNITHTRGLVACGLSRRYDLGVDAEFIERTIELDVAKRLFTREEWEYLASTSVEGIEARFFDIWTLKEAYVKARGLGLLLPFTYFSVLPKAEHDARLSVRAGLFDQRGRHTFFRMIASPYHRLALCVQCPKESSCVLLIKSVSQHEILRSE